MCICVLYDKNILPERGFCLNILLIFITQIIHDAKYTKIQNNEEVTIQIKATQSSSPWLSTANPDFSPRSNYGHQFTMHTSKSSHTHMRAALPLPLFRPSLPEWYVAHRLQFTIFTTISLHNALKIFNC